MYNDITPFTRLLKEEGYWLGYVGKFHNETEGPPTDYGVDEYVPTKRYWKWREEKGLPEQPNQNGWFGEVDPHITPRESRLGWGANHALRMIERNAQKKSPFFIRWDPPEPHLANVVPEPYATMYSPEDMVPWPSFKDTLEGKPYVQRLQRKRWGIDDWTWEQWAPVVGRYLGEITLLDHQIGRILNRLDELGIAENTLVIYTTDHGDFCGGHGMMDKHYAAYDDIVRVPLIMRLPGKLPEGKTSEAMVSHSIDLAKTICGAANIKPPEEYEGENLLEVVKDQYRGGRETVFGMYQGCQMGLWSWRMIRSREWKYVYHATARPEMYNVHDDPGELNNLAEHPDHQQILSDLQTRLVGWMEEIEDPLLNEWTRAQLENGVV